MAARTADISYRQRHAQRMASPTRLSRIERRAKAKQQRIQQPAVANTVMVPTATVTVAQKPEETKSFIRLPWGWHLPARKKGKRGSN